MNLIEKLQATPKWKEFEEWYKDRYMYGKGTDHVNNVLFDHKIKHQHFDEWKGVFEKFIESRRTKVTCFPTDSDELEYGLYWKGHVAGMNHNSFEELLVWYFDQ